MFITQDRTERVIATGRVLLAALALLAVWLDPAEPVRAAPVAYVLMAAYLGYAIGLVPILRPAFAPAAWWPMLTHAMDLTAFALLMQFTAGALSPFFIYFLFSLAAATLRWQWRGALLTGAAALGLFAGLSVYAALAAPQTFDLPVVVSRSVTLLLATGMLAYLGAAHARGLRRLQTLAGWRHAASPERMELLREIAASTSAILGTSRLLIVWEGEEPWIEVVYWDRGRFSTARERPGAFHEITAAALRGRSFICLDAARPNAPVVYVEQQRLHRCRGAPLDSAFRERFIIRSVASWPFEEQGLKGRLFCLDKADITVEDLLYGEILAGLVGSRLAEADLVDALRRSAVAEDRLQLARDLHDGVLQSLTAAALQIQAARRLLLTDPAAAEARLIELQRIVAAEHVDIRRFIEELKPSKPAPADAPVSLGSSLSELASRIQRQWGVEVRIALEPDPLTLPEEMGEHVYLLAHEALVNAARHARATRIILAVLRTPDHLSLAISDDGHGFGFEGRRGLKELIADGTGPASLRDRVAALHGDLTIESGPRGSRVQIELPVAGVPT
ncbi:MAG TPA: histidine kinase [Vicinamibacterales bacterium]|nr:histidine kinase [Vicinamibacterales bacterium]